MKSFFNSFKIYFILLLTSFIHLQLMAGDIDNRNTDIIIKDIVNYTLTPTEVIHNNNSTNSTIIRSYIRKNDRLLPIESLPFKFNHYLCKIQSMHELKATLSNRFFKVSKYKTYKVSAKIKCFQTNKLIFDHESNEGQVISIWDIAQTAVNKFKNINRINFWNKRITFKWPARGNYYSFHTVHISKGHHWDVVGHELGHAIYDLANIGAKKGGSHRIDECYNKILALSEGWASFFSAYLKVDINDKDAKFEYLVKRRAPIRFEHIPSDVCLGETNEWRVTGFLWDLIDSNNDQEQMKEKFVKLWDRTINQKFQSLSSIFEHLGQNQFDKEVLKNIWNQTIIKPFLPSTVKFDMKDR